MPEFPDIAVYIEALEQRILGQRLNQVTITSPFLLRTASPPIAEIEGREVIELRRLGKRICFGFEEDFWLVLHLMIAGRINWKGVVTKPVRATPRGATRPPKNRLATFDFTNGTLSLTEAGTQRRASLHLVQGEEALQEFNAGGLEIFETDLEEFEQRLRSDNHTLKRSLTDPRLFSGIGNAYSDEILWHAQLSPIAMTLKLTPNEVERLFQSTRATIVYWIELLREECGMGDVKSARFPEKVTAFRPEMAVHGKYQQPCPRCGAKVQRIRYASNETNYCPVCQTNGKLLADRALSRLLRSDWPRTADGLENLSSR